MQCYVHNVSPMKKGTVSGSPYFEFMAQTSNTAKKAICFSPGKKRPLSEAADSKNPVKISNFNLSQGSIIVNERSDVKLANSQEIGFQHNSKLASNAIVTLKEMDQLASGQLVNFKAEVSTINVAYSHKTKDKRSIMKQEVIVRDSTRSIKLFLFADYVDSLSLGVCYLFKNTRLKIIKSAAFLNTPLKDEFTAEKIEPIQNLVDDVEQSQTRIVMSCKIAGVSSVSKIFSCPQCLRSCEEEDYITVKCEHCNLLLSPESCVNRWLVSVLLKDVLTNESYIGNLKNDMVHQLADIIKSNLESEQEFVKDILQVKVIFRISFDIVSKEILNISVIE